ncbi:MAG TPA: hypothetical protein DGT23_32400 [Micromonosporaceae bacterium]|nr:hypothetical protein [Micromonosporaceae bacterium]
MVTESLVPQQLRFFCNLCPTEMLGVRAVVDHMVQVHDHIAARWPDGGLVDATFDVPEPMATGDD